MNIDLSRAPEVIIRAGALLLLALILGYSGWRALRRQAIWIPSAGDDLHHTADIDAGGTWVRGRWLRPVGLGLVLLALGCVVGAAATYF